LLALLSAFLLWDSLPESRLSCRCVVNNAHALQLLSTSGEFNASHCALSIAGQQCVRCCCWGSLSNGPAALLQFDVIHHICWSK
jgi:hypothetical protein